MSSLGRRRIRSCTSQNEKIVLENQEAFLYSAKYFPLLTICVFAFFIFAFLTLIFLQIMTAEEISNFAKELMQKAMTHLEDELTKVRTGKANPSMLDSVMVEYYGAPTPINQVANITTPDARTIVVQPWEKKVLQDIERGIINSNLSLNPQNDGEVIRINVPPLTEERRKEMVKVAKNMGEAAKVTIRNARRDANEQVKKAKADGLSEDLAKDLEAKVQTITDKFIADVDTLLAKKEKEILTV